MPSGTTTTGRAYVERLRSLGIDIGAVAVLPDEPTGTALIVVDEAGENTIVVAPGPTGTSAPTPWRPSTLGRARRRAARPARGPSATRSPRPAVSRPTAECGWCSTSRRTPSCPPTSSPLADPVVANEHEARLLDGPRHHAAVAARDAAVRTERTGTACASPPSRCRPTRCVDTTGAGDAFCGALAAALARRTTTGESALRGGPRRRSGRGPPRTGAQPDAGL